MFGLLAEPDVWSYTDSEPPASVEELAARHRRLESRQSPDGTELWLNWAVRYGSELIGFVQATVRPDRRIDLAYVIGKRFWGRGFATDAARTMVDFLDAAFPGADMIASVDHRNTASLKLLSRLGLIVCDESDPGNVLLRRAR
jgi:ribosomal-protein-alanine N-acetyltransferase